MRERYGAGCRHGTRRSLLALLWAMFTSQGMGTAISVEVLPAGTASDTTPDPFTFGNRNGVATGTLVTSNAITISGIDGPAPLTLSGVASRSYSVNNGPFVKIAGTVNAGDVIRLRLMSAGTASTARTATLTVGGVSATWRVRTGATDTTADKFTFATRQNANVDSNVTSPGIVVSGINAPAPIAVSGAKRSSYSVNGGPFVTRAGTVNDGDSVRVRHTASAQLLTESMTVLLIGGARGTFTSVTRDTRTYQEGSSVYLERRVEDDIQRVGMRLDWGSSIVEVSLNGTNFVNASDPGREIQLALYDARDSYVVCGSCEPVSTVWGWNPVQGGDTWVHGSPTAEHRLNPNSIYIRSLPLEWYPDDKGGGPDMAVASDVQFEQWVTAATGQAGGFKVHSRITHLGNDRHRATDQEIPAVYCNVDYEIFESYAGSFPWTNDATSSTTWPDLGINGDMHGAAVTTERWGACVDSMGVGMTVYVPQAYPRASGFHVPGSPGANGYGTNYFKLFTVFDIDASAVIESDFYILPGDFRVARSAIYDLRHVSTSDFLDPDSAFDTPAEGEQISGAIPVAGWAWDNDESQGGYVASVKVFVDGTLVGPADLHQPRPDVAEAIVGTPPDTGYILELDTTAYVNGHHQVRVVVTDFNGNSVGVTHRVTIAN